MTFAFALAYLLGASSFGAYSIGIAAATFLMSVGSLNLGPILARNSAQGVDQDVLPQHLAGALSLTSVGTAISLPIATVALGLTGAGGTELVSMPARLSVALIGGSAAFTLVFSFFAQGLNDFRTYSVLMAMRAVLPAGLAIVAVVLVAPSASVALFGQALGEVLTLGYAVWRFRPYLRRPNVRIVRDFGALPIWTGGGVLITSGALLTIPIIIDRSLGLVALANYALAQRLYVGLSFVLYSAVSTVAPRMYKLMAAKDLNLSRLFRSLHVVWLSLVATLCAIFVTAWIASLVAPPAYSELPAVLAATAVIAVGYAANSLSNYLAMARGHMRAWVLSDVFLASAVIVLSITLVARLGAMGASLAQGLAFVASALGLVVWTAALAPREQSE